MTDPVLGQTESEYNPLALRYSEGISIPMYRDIPEEIKDKIEYHIQCCPHGWNFISTGDLPNSYILAGIPGTILMSYFSGLTQFQLKNYFDRHGDKLSQRIIEAYNDLVISYSFSLFETSKQPIRHKPWIGIRGQKFKGGRGDG